MKMTFLKHVDIMVAKTIAMLGFIRRLSLEFRDPYTLKSSTRLWFVQNWNTQVACGTRFMMFVLTEWNEWNAFIRYALRGLGWTDKHDLPPYEDRCALLHLGTLNNRRGG
jgi:hypothetical protein